MDSFPSIFSTTTPPDHLSLNNMMIDNNSRSYIEIQNNKIMGFDISPDDDDHSSGLMATNHGSAAPGQQDVDSRSSSLVSGESTGGDHHHGRLMKMDKVIKKDKKMKKARYAFQTRSQVDILDDGYRWRKYGQKAVKNNRFPRSYYRCTYQGCNVKKQVQRLSKDEEVVVTTYEGMHSHPIEKSTDNFEHILTQMKIYTSS